MLFRLFLVLKTRLLGLCILVSLCVLGLVASISHANTKNPSILILGDSLSAAYGIPQQQGWVALLHSRLKSEHYPYQVINASISGETSRGGLSRIDALLQQHQPRIVILALGANDGLRGLPVKEMAANLDAMIKKSKQKGARVLLIGMKIPPNYGPKYTADFSQSFLQLSKQHNIALLPFMLENVAVKTSLIQDDGLHPNALGQLIILDNIWSKLQLLLKDKPAIAH